MRVLSPSSLRPWLALPLLSMAVACGDSAFVVSPTQLNGTPPGSFSIPARVDLVVGLDDSGSILGINQEIRSQLPGFLAQLESQGWDYHLGATSLVAPRPLTQVLASRYDSNWGEAWIPPYPGAARGVSGMVRADLFRRPDDFTAFQFPVASPMSTAEPGLQNLRDFLLRPEIDTDLGDAGFLRRDALLVVMAISNGEDSSGVELCNRGDGLLQACSAAQAQASLENYRSSLLALKQWQAAKVQFYSLTASTTSCLGQTSMIGTRYQAMARALGGKDYSLCRANALAQLLSDLGERLREQRLALVQRYAFLPERPNPERITVFKRTADGKRQTVIQDDVNGWSFPRHPLSGEIINDRPIEDYALYVVGPSGTPVYYNLTRGFALQLNGTAQARGAERIDVNYLPFGLNDTTTPARSTR